MTNYLSSAVWLSGVLCVQPASDNALLAITATIINRM
jgi:hypothetical protein